jgi:hypothetical protein
MHPVMQSLLAIGSVFSDSCFTENSSQATNSRRCKMKESFGDRKVYLGDSFRFQFSILSKKRKDETGVT